MAALLGPAIGARTCRQEDFGHTAPRPMAQHKTIKPFIVSLSLILLYHFLDGSPTGPIKAKPTNLSSGTVDCFAPPTSSLTEIFLPRNTKHAQRSIHVYSTHKTQITPLTSTIDEHFPQTWSPGHHPRQDQTRNYPKQKCQHTIHNNPSYKYHNPPHYLPRRLLRG